ncbi:hypothetical protein EOPP23_01695 [Endozoicomonas sp. OPT23]|uniref:hypothetical protein n=1 Tax=Endozoicomonas sp. OPT23 TaxID=2072845 RepID=UPI00129AE17D|nr:hypothetical protein [Endozoicomonas sp. OPT23]MRI31708.1 hypothetical protein [Endozoicomonas sp. OPT23]
MKTTFKMALVGAALTIASTTFAAAIPTDLTVSKKENVAVKLTVPKLINVTKPADFTMKFDGNSAQSVTQKFCIASNMGTDTPVSLILTDSKSAQNKFELVNTDSKLTDHNTVPFTVTYITEGQEKGITYGKKHDDIKGAQWLSDCNDTSSLKIDITKENMLKVYNGEYTATLQMTVSVD